MSGFYNVVFSGVIVEGKTLSDVKVAFAKCFKIDETKAERFFNGKSHQLRKNADQKTALHFKAVLEKVGLVVELVSVEPVMSLEPQNPSEINQDKKPAQQEVATGDQSSTTDSKSTKANPNSFEHDEDSTPKPTGLDGLALVPIEGEAPTTPDKPKVAAPITKVILPFKCPKCEVEQKKGLECVECGIIFEKYFARLESGGQSSRSSENSVAGLKSNGDSKRESSGGVLSLLLDDGFNKNALIAVAVTAFLGALIWKFIAIAFSVELGLIAWAIGGAIGFAAYMFDAHGEKAGMICGAFALVAIIGGKFMVFDSLKDQLLNAPSLSAENEELREIYQYELELASQYGASVTSDEELKAFVFEHGFSDADDITTVTEDELNYFNEFVKPDLETMSVTLPTYEQWIEKSVLSKVEDLSTFAMIKEDFGFRDILFLLFGVGTAFRLGSGFKK